MTKHELKYGAHTIEFFLTRKSVKNINLSLKPNLTVHVSANHDVPLEKIHSFVKKKASWILKNMNYFIQSQSEINLDKEYVSGETFKYLGRQYRLKVIEAKTEEIKCSCGRLNLYVRNKDDVVRKANIINEWFRKRAYFIFNESLKRMFKLLKKYNIEEPAIQIRQMKARWGSCLEKKQIILLNFELIRAPRFCIDYVILHELLHFKHRNHDKDFYRLQDGLMPDWRKRKEILDIEVVKNL